eukprot:TRINITY_DN18479_c0_g1_i3.p1 TRINITY_DN18479_c0_g1~~TRINITY_DN18479_c0_g1_i3.p1  ORF type:complete len:519 (-),score=157.52 TRINITY_DN18479_c0_g1_i3:482-2038(-)
MSASPVERPLDSPPTGLEGDLPLRRTTSSFTALLDSCLEGTVVGNAGMRGDVEVAALRGELSRSLNMTAALQDENLKLREEHMRMRSTLQPQGNRRQMAAIAGGGFRGPSAQLVQKPCQCDALRLRLAQLKLELRQAKRQPPSQQSANMPLEVVNAEDPILPGQSCACTQTEATQPSAAVADGCVQASLDLPRVRTSEVGVGTGAAHLADAEVQAEFEAQPLSPKAAVQVVEFAAQTCWKEQLREASLQAGCAFACLVSSETQTEEEEADSLHTEQLLPEVREMDAQTEPWEPAPQPVEPPSPVQRPVMSHVGMQTLQEPVRLTTASATQTTAPPRLDCHVQTMPMQEDGQVDALRKRLVDAEAASNLLRKKSAELETQMKDRLEQLELWRDTAQKQMLGQMNVTILCPRAECTVNGDHLQMDSWDPAKLRAEFERDVLPRFARVFVEEEPRGSGAAAAASRKPSKASTGAPGKRPEVVERAMKEFADVFRDRLAAMLSAPTAAQAVHAARGTTGKGK